MDEINLLSPGGLSLMSFPQYYHNAILCISERTGFSDSVLHIHAGLTILLIVHIVSRRSFATFIPFAFVVLAEGVNELLDYLAHGWRPTDTCLDIVNTLFWPFTISLVARVQPISKR